MQTEIEIIEPKKKKSKKSGIRARDLILALSDIDELRRQDPSFSKPTYLIDDIQVVVEQRASAKDMALYEALLAIAKDSGMAKDRHSIKAEILMDYLQTDSVDRLIDALIRIASTTVVFEVRDIKRKRRLTGVSSLIQFVMETDLSSSDKPEKLKGDLKRLVSRGGALLHYKVPPVIRQAFLEPKAYAWINLYSISQFTTKYTNALYQLLAIKASHDPKYMRPLEISVQELADKMGWRQPKGQAFNAALFMMRCLNPALEDIRYHVRDFSVVLDEPVRDQGKRGRPLKAFVFHVLPTPLHLLPATALKGKKRQKLARSMRMDVCMPDQNHPSEWLPTVDAVTRVSQALMKSNFWGNRHIASENDYRPKHLSLWWRTVLDVALQDESIQLTKSMSGADILSALDNPYEGADRAFMKWALDEPVNMASLERAGFMIRTHLLAPAAKNRALPDKLFMREAVYVGFANMLRVAEDLSSVYVKKLPVTDYSLSTHFILNPWMWEAVAAASLTAGTNVGGLTKAMALMSRAHPVRMRWTAKNIGQAIFDHDWSRIEKIMKAVFAQSDKLDRSPVDGKIMPKREDAEAPMKMNRDDESGEIFPRFH
ncbi:replication initiation protein [Agrobacterium tumefaciens]|uniref:replication initiation protein n=1 Tax=Agrobacterium tumefaciens TaxID=358 RepID=UPI00045A4E00|nr:replication initiation protein [Agrobacterium tumefaciens]CDN96498.1 Protein involved in initiation of plasmid replication [Agrobacterium tumefaciens]